MPHATPISEPVAPRPKKSARGSRPSGNKQLQQVQQLFSESKALFDQSPLAASLQSTLRARLSVRAPVTKVVSLGLGSFAERSKDQTRRFKQLAMLVALADLVRTLQPTDVPRVELYAQDPSFTRADALFLNTLGIEVLKTPSPSDLGEAQRVIDQDTLVYSPFLTIDAYQMLLASCKIGLLLGDDFNALRLKFDKNTDDHRSVEQMLKRHVAHYKRRVVSGAGFWEDEDRPFPMAMYWRQDTDTSRAKL